MTSDKPLIIRRKKKRLKGQKSALENNESSKQNNQIEQTNKDKNYVDELTKIVIKALGNTSDLKKDNIKIAGMDAILYCLESMIDIGNMQHTLLNKITNEMDPKYDTQSDEGIRKICEVIFGGGAFSIIDSSNHDRVIDGLLNGFTVIAIKPFSSFIMIGMSTSKYRQVSEPSSQTVIRGPKDNFIEEAITNQSLIRRRIKNQNLSFEQFLIGNDTKTKVVIGYVKGIVNDSIVDEIRNRIKRINVSAIFESKNIEELIVDKTNTIFPLILETERPDAAAAHLMEGKVCIIVDGTPFILIAPCVFTDFFISPEDYYNHYVVSSFLRLLRYISFMIVLLTPSFYVGILTFHHELLPTYLLINIIAQREGVPFPAFVEVFIMEITFEILREAGIRMPRAIGPTVSIVGGLVIGQAAAQAGLISNIMVIIVSITATANFVAPYYSMASATRILRFVLVPIAAVFGLYGVLLGLVIMVAHLASLRSFGVPYLAPMAPFKLKDQKDVFIRFPYWAMNKRPSYLMTAKKDKQAATGSPTPPDMLRRNGE